MPKTSKAAQIRKERGIIQQKNQANVEAGKRTGFKPKAVTRRANEIEAQLSALKENEPQAESVAIETIKEKPLDIQQLRKNASLKAFQENAEKVSERLVRLALGQGTFADAPASVQRLAMIDCLKLAGITEDSASTQTKPVHEMNKSELEIFINSTKALIEKHDQSNKGRLIDGDML